MRTPADEAMTVLALQGGGALGAYQAGAYEGLTEAGIEPDWVAGISIGSINAALIAGNKPADRVAALREFWRRVSSELDGKPFFQDEWSRELFNNANAARVLMSGVPGFFRMKFPPAVLSPDGSPDALGIYTTSPLAKTLQELVDFSLISGKGNGGANKPIRFSVGAVDVATGNYAYFDNEKHEIGPLHVMASGALPPGLPPIKIGDSFYWDGGLVSNTPLDYVLRNKGSECELCAFQLDLFSSRGSLPQNLLDVAQRTKDIRFSSRTRLNTDNFTELQTIKRAARRLLAELPPELAEQPSAKRLAEWSDDTAVTIYHLIYRVNAYENAAKDFEFSRLSADEHWAAGLADVRRLVASKAWAAREKPKDGVTVIDANKLTAPPQAAE
jgi:NTE family protein